MVVVMPSTPKERQLAELAKFQFGDTEYRNYKEGSIYMQYSRRKNVIGSLLLWLKNFKSITSNQEPLHVASIYNTLIAMV